MAMAVARAVVSGSQPGTTTHFASLESTAEKDAQSAAVGIRFASHMTSSSSVGSWSTRTGRTGCVAMRSGLGWRAAEFNGAESLAPRPSVERALGESKLSEKEEGRRRRRRRRRGTAMTARAESQWPPTRSTSMAASGLSEQETAVHVVDAPLSSSESELLLQRREGLITIGLPKGSLQQATADLFLRAGYNIKIHERSYLPDVDDKELNVVLFRGQEISRYVEDGVLDAGICGHDWVVENGSDVQEVCELNYSKATARPVRWVLAVPESSKVTSIHDLAGGIVATELIKTTERYFQKHGVPVQKVEYSWGATEVKALLPGVQGIVDITETGSSLRANKLRILDTILTSTTRLIANHTSWSDPMKREKIEDIAMLLQGAVAGRGKVGMKMNVERRLLDDFTKLLPSEHSPTISPLLDDTYCAVEVVCSVVQARDLLPKVKRLGADGIFTYPLDVLIR